MFEAYKTHWDQGQTRARTLEMLRSLGETSVQEDMMLTFQIHAMYFFEENSLPFDPQEEEFNKIQAAVINGEIVPKNV